MTCKLSRNAGVRETAFSFSSFSRRRRISCRRATRRTGLPVSRRIDVAFSRSVSGNAVVLALMPMPMTTNSTRSISALISVRMPQIFLVPATMSFGHLIIASQPVTSRMAPQTAAPARSVVAATAEGQHAGAEKHGKPHAGSGGRNPVPAEAPLAARLLLRDEKAAARRTLQRLPLRFFVGGVDRCRSRRRSGQASRSRGPRRSLPANTGPGTRQADSRGWLRSRFHTLRSRRRLMFFHTAVRVTCSMCAQFLAGDKAAAFPKLLQNFFLCRHSNRRPFRFVSLYYSRQTSPGASAGMLPPGSVCAIIR